MKLLHATQIATKGIIGSTVGLSTKGHIVSIFEFVPPQPTPTHFPSIGGGGGSFGISKGKKKVIIVTVYAYGEKVTTRHVVNSKAKISISDIEITENENGPVTVSIRRTNKK